MSFPANNAATAVVITSLPFTITDTFGGTPFGTTWFSYTVSSELMLGVHLGSTVGVVDVLPFKTIALTPTVPSFCDKTHPIQIGVIAGITYYFKIEGDAGGVSSITLTIHGNPTQTIVPGQIWVPDPSIVGAFPATILDFTATAVTNIAPLANADQIDCLPNGIICAAAIPAPIGTARVNEFILYTNNPVSVIATVPNPIAPSMMFVKQDYVDSFFVAKSIFGAAPLKVYKIHDDGTLDPTNWTLPGVTLAAFAVSVGGLKAYTSDFSVDTPVGAFDLVNNVALANFAAGVTGYKINSITVLSDNSVVVTYIKTSDNSIRIIRYNSAGISQATFNAPVGDTFVGNIAEYDATRVILRTESGPLKASTFWLLLASNLSDLGHFTVDNFDDGIGNNNTPQFFGPSEASGIAVFKTSVAPSGVGGIYKIVPDKTNDTLYTNSLGATMDFKIPDPFAITSLIGDDNG